MRTLFYLISVALYPGVILANEDEIIWEIPFEKSKVNYHRSKVCITIKGLTNCVNKNRQPGDPNEVAEMFRLLKTHTQLSSKESSGDGGDEDDASRNYDDQKENDQEMSKKLLNNGLVDLDEEHVKEVIHDGEDTDRKKLKVELENNEETGKVIQTSKSSKNAVVFPNKPPELQNEDPRESDLQRTIDLMDLNRKWTDDVDFDGRIR